MEEVFLVHLKISLKTYRCRQYGQLVLEFTALKDCGCYADQLLQSLSILFFSKNLLKFVNIPRQKMWCQFCCKIGGTLYTGF